MHVQKKTFLIVSDIESAEDNWSAILYEYIKLQCDLHSTNQGCQWEIIKEVCKDLPNIRIAIPASTRKLYCIRKESNYFPKHVYGN